MQYLSTSNGHTAAPVSNCNGGDPPLTCSGDTPSVLDTVIVHCPVVLHNSLPSPAELTDKENIDAAPPTDKPSPPVTAQFPQPIRAPPSLIYAPKSPLKVHISNVDFLSSPLVSPLVASSPYSYATSFLNREVHNLSLLSPSAGKPSPVKFNPIALAAEVRQSIGRQFPPEEALVYGTNCRTNAVADSSPFIDYFRHSIARQSTGTGNTERYPVDVSARIELCLAAYRGMSPASVVDRSTELLAIVEDAKDDRNRSPMIAERTKPFAESSPASPVVNRKSGANYGFRPMKMAPHYEESPVFDYAKRKSWKTKPGKRKIVKLPDCVFVQSVTEQLTNAGGNGEAEVVTLDEEISFFDIHCRKDDSVEEDFTGNTLGAANS